MKPRNQEVTEHERTTTEVLIAYRMSAFGYNDMPDDAPHAPEELAEVDAEFHNWLNEVRAEAWDAALDDAYRIASATATRTQSIDATLAALRTGKKERKS